MPTVVSIPLDILERVRRSPAILWGVALEAKYRDPEVALTLSEVGRRAGMPASQACKLSRRLEAEGLLALRRRRSGRLVDLEPLFPDWLAPGTRERVLAALRAVSETEVEDATA